MLYPKLTASDVWSWSLASEFCGAPKAILICTSGEMLTGRARGISLSRKSSERARPRKRSPSYLDKQVAIDGINNPGSLTSILLEADFCPGTS